MLHLTDEQWKAIDRATEPATRKASRLTEQWRRARCAYCVALAITPPSIALVVVLAVLAVDSENGSILVTLAGATGINVPLAGFFMFFYKNQEKWEEKREQWRLAVAILRMAILQRDWQMMFGVLSSNPAVADLAKRIARVIRDNS